MKRTHYRTCNLCEAICGIAIDVDGDQVVRIRGDEKDPFSQGHICPKAHALGEFHHDPDRLRRPLIKRQGRWQRIDWKPALDEVANRLHRIQSNHGTNAVGIYVGNPTIHNLPALTVGPTFLRAMRTHHRFSASSVDQLPHMVASHAVFGHQLFLPVPDIDRTDFMVILGANPIVSNGSLMSPGGFRRRFQALNERGESWVFDPRRTATAKEATRHFFIRPGTDAFFLAALVHTLFEQGVQLGRLAPHIQGLDTLRQWCAPFTAERAAAITGVDAQTIRTLATRLRETKRAVVYGRMGVSTQSYGGLCAYLLVVVNTLSGHLDVPGGAMFTTPAFPALELAGPGKKGRWHSSVRKLPEFGGELPASTMAEEIEAGAIRAMVTVGGNPVLSTPSGDNLGRAMDQLDFMVSVDPYLNETTQHADVILPPASPLERPHYDLVLHALAVRNSAKYAPALFQANGPNDGQILAGLLRRIMAHRHGRLHPETLKARALEHLPTETILDFGLRFGPYGAGALGVKPTRIGGQQLGPKGTLSLATLKANPHGVDLGPLMPAFPDRAPSPTIALAPAEYEGEFARLREMKPRETGSMHLIGRRELRSNNSWMHNAPSLMKGKNRCTLMIHPADAKAHGLKNGDMVRMSVGDAPGAVVVPAQITDQVMEGVVSLPHGYGHRGAGVRMQVATKNAGVSVNDIIPIEALDPLTGTAALNGVEVKIRAADVTVEA